MTSISETEELLISCAEILGPDIEYVTAEDEHKHSDDMMYAVEIIKEVLLKFYAAALAEAAKILSKDSGKELVKRIDSWSETSNTTADTQTITEGKDLFKEAVFAVEQELVNDLFKGGTEAVKARLVTNNIPEEKAKAIATRMEQKLRAYIR